MRPYFRLESVQIFIRKARYFSYQLHDVEHIIYSLGDNRDKGILDITIDNITTDEGLAVPYGIAEIELSVVYRLEN